MQVASLSLTAQQEVGSRRRVPFCVPAVHDGPGPTGRVRPASQDGQPDRLMSGPPAERITGSDVWAVTGGQHLVLVAAAAGEVEGEAPSAG